MPHTGLTLCVVLAGFLFGIITPSCKKPTEPPPPGEQPVSFAAIDASCTEVWLSVKFHPDAQPPYGVVDRTIEIKRDTLSVLTTTLTGTDTLIVDEGLLPNREYTYTLTRPGVWQDRPLTATISTMDTTSHNWIFDPPVLLGDGSSSVLYDVAIVRSDPDSPLVIAVGELYLSGEPTRYNMAMWDGTDWSIHRVPYYYQGQPFYHPIQTVFAFAANDIWFAGNGVIRWNGQAYVPIEIPASVWGPNRINKIWGHDGEIWIVGDGGSIAHRSASGTWRRLESGTTLDVRDLWGATNQQTREFELIALASTFNTQVQECRLLKITSSGAVSLENGGLSPSLRGVWFVPRKQYYAVGAGIHRKRMLGDSLWRVYPSGAVTFYHSGGVRGADVNDVFVAGSFREVVHFNGMTWHRYENLMPGSSGSFGPVVIKGNLMATVGLASPHALAAIGRR